MDMSLLRLAIRGYDDVSYVELLLMNGANPSAKTENELDLVEEMTCVYSKRDKAATDYGELVLPLLKAYMKVPTEDEHQHPLPIVNHDDLVPLSYTEGVHEMQLGCNKIYNLMGHPVRVLGAEGILVTIPEMVSFTDITRLPDTSTPFEPEVWGIRYTELVDSVMSIPLVMVAYTGVERYETSSPPERVYARTYIVDRKTALALAYTKLDFLIPGQLSEDRMYYKNMYVLSLPSPKQA